MWSPDDLDIQIIKAMASPHSFQWDVRISNANVAKGLDIDEETVRNRLKHMNEAGFLQGWQLILNPILLGRKAAIVDLRVKESESKSELISQLSLLDGVTFIEDFYGNDLAAHLLYMDEDTLIRQVQMISILSGHPIPKWRRESFPPCVLNPTNTEWRIIRALRMNARGKLSDVAHDLHLSNRTVKRHMLHLVEGNAFYLDPLLDIGKIGGVRCRFLVVCDPNKKKVIDVKALTTLSRIISTHTAPEDYSIFVVHCGNASEVKRISHWLEMLDGVKEVRSNFDVEHIHVQGWLAGEIEKRLST
jgi:DNA-binding Lrp family transcriptional regulator